VFRWLLRPESVLGVGIFRSTLNKANIQRLNPSMSKVHGFLPNSFLEVLANFSNPLQWGVYPDSKSSSCWLDLATSHFGFSSDESNSAGRLLIHSRLFRIFLHSLHKQSPDSTIPLWTSSILVLLDFVPGSFPSWHPSFLLGVPTITYHVYIVPSGCSC